MPVSVKEIRSNYLFKEFTDSLALHGSHFIDTLASVKSVRNLNHLVNWHILRFFSTRSLSFPCLLQVPHNAPGFLFQGSYRISSFLKAEEISTILKILSETKATLNAQVSWKWKRSLQVQFGSSDNVIKVLLSLSVFLTHPHHQQQFVSIHFPPHLLGLCVPGLTKEKQRRRHIIRFYNYTSTNGYITIISYTLHWRNISLNCHSGGLVVTFFCSSVMEHRKVGERGWYKPTSMCFPVVSPWIKRKRRCLEH